MWFFIFTLFPGPAGYSEAYRYLAGQLTSDFSPTVGPTVPVQ